MLIQAVFTFSTLCLLMLGEMVQCERAEKRIIGGDFAPPAKYPWAVSILGDKPESFVDSMVCGASFISDRWLLTAAHCFYSLWGKRTKDLRDVKYWHITAGQVFVKLVFNDRRLDAADIANHFHIDKFVLHPKYTIENIEWDIALIRINRPIPVGSMPGIAHVKLPSETKKPFPPIDDTCVIVGWGCTMVGGSFNPKAKFLDLKVVTFDVCDKAYKNESGVNDEHEFCAGFLNGKRGICPGDSGSGLICKQNGENVIAGIASATDTEYPESFPGIFTRVAYFNSWIKSVMASN